MSYDFPENEILLEAFKKIMRVILPEAIKELEFGRPYTLEEIIPEFMSALDVFERRISGRAVAILVREGLLPLEYDGKTSANHCRYIRR